MNHPSLPASFSRRAISAAASSLFLLPALSAQAAEPGPIGGEFQVNTVTAGDQGTPSIARDADGDFVVAWEAGTIGSFDIRAQRYNAAGVAQGGEINVNTLITESQGDPAVAMDADGDFVVTWQSTVSSANEIRAQRYNTAGLAQGKEFLIGAGIDPAIALDANGNFVVAWTTGGSGAFDIRAQRYNNAGVAQGTLISVNTATTGDQRDPSIAIDANGDFVVSWASAAAGTFDIRAQRYNSTGVAQGTEINVNSFISNSQRYPVVAMDAEGDFAIAWGSDLTGSPDNNYEVRAQRYNAAGQTQGSEFQVNTQTLNFQRRPSIAMDADGDFVVTWITSADDYDVHARRYSAAGTAQGGEFKVNTLTAGAQRDHAVAMDADGDFIVAWESRIAGSYEIRAQRYQGPDSVDISLFQTDSADPAPVGSPVSYTLSVGNLQTPTFLTGIAAIDDAIGSATGLKLVDTLPAGTTVLSAVGLNWSCTQPAGKVACDYALPLLAGEQASNVVVTLTPPNTPGVLLTNVGRAAADQFDDDKLNNREVESTQLVCAESLIELSTSDYSVAENAGSVTITATRSGGACGVATVQFDTAGSSATPGLDFTDVTGTLSWADGESGNKTFSIPVTNDGLDEIDERVQIALGSASGARLGTRNGAQLSITDDDAAPRINFSSGSQSVAESAGLTTVTLRLSQVSGRDVTVPLSFAVGNASNEGDYVPGGNTLTIAAGQTQASIDIEIVNDGLDEIDETAVIGMGSVIGATIGTVATQQLTIIDDDASAVPTVSFDIAAASADEASANTVTVQLSAASAVTVTVPYTRSGSATFNTDYSLSRSSPVTFNPGQTTRTIVITPVNDTTDEPDESAILTLGTPTNATLGTTTVHTRTIVDNDP